MTTLALYYNMTPQLFTAMNTILTDLFPYSSLLLYWSKKRVMAGLEQRGMFFSQTCTNFIRLQEISNSIIYRVMNSITENGSDRIQMQNIYYLVGKFLWLHKYKFLYTVSQLYKLRNASSVGDRVQLSLYSTDTIAIKSTGLGC